MYLRDSIINATILLDVISQWKGKMAEQSLLTLLNIHREPPFPSEVWREWGKRLRMEISLIFIGPQQFSRKKYMQLFPGMSTAAASRDLFDGVKRNLLEKQGDKAVTLYVAKTILVSKKK